MKKLSRMQHVVVKSSTNVCTCNENVFRYVIVCTSQYVQMSTLLWCHTNEIAQILVVYMKQYISVHNIGNSLCKDINTELDIPKVATGEYNNVQ